MVMVVMDIVAAMAVMPGNMAMAAMVALVLLVEMVLRARWLHPARRVRLVSQAVLVMTELMVEAVRVDQ